MHRCVTETWRFYSDRIGGAYELLPGTGRFRAPAVRRVHLRGCNARFWEPRTGLTRPARFTDNRSAHSVASSAFLRRDMPL